MKDVFLSIVLNEMMMTSLLLLLDPWLMADTSVPLWDMLPLVTRLIFYIYTLLFFLSVLFCLFVSNKRLKGLPDQSQVLFVTSHNPR